jgi:carotenoid cleavage dioxygenase
MVHDFMVTENHVLFPVLPLSGSLERAMGGRPPFAWEPQKGSYVGVMRRDADVSTIRWFNTEACYVFHPLNSWEEGDKIYCDVMRYNVAPLFPNADGTPARRPPLGWCAGRSTCRRVRRHPGNPAGRPGRRVPAGRSAGRDAQAPPRLVRRRSDRQRHDPPVRHRPPRPSDRQAPGLRTARRRPHLRAGVRAALGGDAEGDGWLTAVVWRAGENRSDLLVFEALDVAKGPIATAELPRRVPFGFHGNWAAL